MKEFSILLFTFIYMDLFDSLFPFQNANEYHAFLFYHPQNAELCGYGACN